MIIRHLIPRLRVEGWQPELCRLVPNTICDLRRIFQGVVFLVDLQIAVADHIEDTSKRRPVVLVLVGGEIARAEREFCSAGLAAILAVEQDDVDSVRRFRHLNLARDLEKDGHSGRAVVGAGNRQQPLRRIGILVSPWPRVPMRAQQNAMRFFYSETGNDVGQALGLWQVGQFFHERLFGDERAVLS